MTFSQRIYCLGFILAAILVTPSGVFAFPDKSVKIIVAYPPGGGVDFVGRTISQRLTERWKQSVIVENRAGASGSIGAISVVKSAADGYTLLLASPAEVLVGPIAGQKVPYDSERDLIPIALVGETPLAVVVHPSTGLNSLESLIEAAKKRPGALSYGTPGSGSSMHFAGESLKANSGVFIVHVPYRGAAPAVTDLLGNQIPVGIVGLPPVVPHERSGKLKILAVTSTKRSSALPGIPSVSETKGMSGFRFTNWMMLYAPVGTPQSVIDRIANEITSVVSEPAIKEKLLGGGVEPMGLIGSDLAKFIQDERSRYAYLVKTRGISTTD